MRDRKLSDQTLPVKEAGTLVSPLENNYDLAAAKSRRLRTRPTTVVLSGCACSTSISGLSRDGSRNLHADRAGKIALSGAFARIA